MTPRFPSVAAFSGLFGERGSFHHRNGADRPVECATCHRVVFVKANGARRKYCSLACMVSRDQSGDRNPNWRGGRAIYYGRGWKATKKQVRERDRLCRSCGKTPEANGRALDVHHFDPFRFSGDNSFDNLVALCRSCHMRADDHGRRGHGRFLRMQGIVKGPTKREVRRSEARRRKIERLRARAMLQAQAFELSAAGRSLREIARESSRSPIKPSPTGSRAL